MMLEHFIGSSISALLLTLRVGPLLIISPPFSQLRVPMRVRACLALSLGLCLTESGSYASLATMQLGELAIAALAELAFGLFIAFAFQMAFGALAFAGRVVDVQAGFGLAMVIDPGSRQQAPLFGTVFTLVAGMIFFSTDGARELFRLISNLVRLMPPGLSHFSIDIERLIAYIGLVMAAGLVAASALMLALFMIDVVIAFLSRTLPQMNAMMFGLQVKTVATVLIASLSVGLLAPATLQLLNLALGLVSHAV